MRCDVVIIGAGPAGCACAIQALMAGLSVVLIEREHFPRYRPGETLHPGIEPLLDSLGVSLHSKDINFRRFSGIWQKSVSGDISFNAFSGRHQHWQGFQVRRHAFDQLLLQRVRDLGGHIFMGSIATIHHSNSPWTISVGSDEFSARHLVDASGGHGYLKRLFGLQKCYHSPMFYLRFGYVEVAADLHEDAMFESCMDGWLYQAQIDERTRHWCRLSNRRIKKQYKPESLAGHSVLGAIKGYDASWQSISPVAGQGYFIVGDAAYRLDPSSSHGVLKAMMSGVYVAHLMMKEKQGIIKKDIAGQIYQAYIRDALQHDVRHLKASEWYRSVKAV